MDSFSCYTNTRTRIQTHARVHTHAYTHTPDASTYMRERTAVIHIDMLQRSRRNIPAANHITVQIALYLSGSQKHVAESAPIFGTHVVIDKDVDAGVEGIKNEGEAPGDVEDIGVFSSHTELRV